MPTPYPHPRAWSTTIPDNTRWDTIVIGTGIGGLTTARLLAQVGHRVLLLEQHYVPGGYTHVFQRQGFVWDVGVHLVGQTDRATMPGRILHALTGDEVKWAPLGDVYDTFSFPDQEHFAFPNHPQAFRAMLHDRFPHEARGIDDFLAHTRATSHAMRTYFLDRTMPSWLSNTAGKLYASGARKHLSQTASDVVASYIQDPKLRTLLLAQWGYHGTLPNEASWAAQAMVMRHFAHGAAYPVGGAGEIARAMLKGVQEAGGWTVIRARVDQIICRQGRAIGVRLADGREVFAPRVVSAVGAHTTVAKLLPAPIQQQSWASEVAHLGAGPAHLALYVGFEGDIASLGATVASQWTYTTWEHGPHQIWDIHPDRPVPAPSVLFTSFPSLKDPAHVAGDPPHHTGEVITFVPYDAFSKWRGSTWRKRGDDYLAFKDRLTEQILNTLRPTNPALWDKVVHAELGTPLSSEHFAAPYRGSIYGLEHTPRRFLTGGLGAKTPVKGLYLSGTDVSLCGIVGGMMGGVLAALAIEPIAVTKSLRHQRSA